MIFAELLIDFWLLFHCYSIIFHLFWIDFFIPLRSFLGKLSTQRASQSIHPFRSHAGLRLTRPGPLARRTCPCFVSVFVCSWASLEQSALDVASETPPRKAKAHRGLQTLPRQLKMHPRLVQPRSSSQKFFLVGFSRFNDFTSCWQI